ncbi:MAG TPA: hypothetical protein VFA16_15750, partial [Mycobacterium sp.]|uniref:hypothetical protein n=1 Tax=Mycobacterium sp. TaxID=1785 RepID=UPI002D450976
MAAVLAARTDLDRYGDCKRALFALELATDGTEDIHVIADDALTDGSDDKSIDILYVDRHQCVAYLIQAYEAKTRQSVEVKKVATLHGAAAWALGKDGNAPSTRIRNAVEELRRALDDGQIGEVRIWFVHNLPADAAVDVELRQT